VADAEVAEGVDDILLEQDAVAGDDFLDELRGGFRGMGRCTHGWRLLGFRCEAKATG
jgi:hypothetical protein